MAPKTMKAIKIVEGHKAEIKTVPLPKLRDDYVLCKVKAVALNPTDWKHIDYFGKSGSTTGCDFAGVVEEVGSKVSKQWKKGDRIATVVHGGNESQPEDGCFAEYAVAKGDLGLRVPDGMSDEEAATLGAGVNTVGLALYKALDLPLPGSGNYGGYLLIYGGSTASGTLAIQYAVLSGCKVIATSSPHNFQLLKSLGVEAVFDYKDPDSIKKIKKYTNDDLRVVLDCIAEHGSPDFCEQVISSKGGTISDLLERAKHSRADVTIKRPLAYTAFGEAFTKFGRQFPAVPEDFEYTRMFFEVTQMLLDEGKLRPHPMKVGADGLEGVFDGFQQFRDGKVSGAKLVYRVGETP